MVRVVAGNDSEPHVPDGSSTGPSTTTIPGGRFFERFVDGDELQVGTVMSCSPPDRIVFTWRSPQWRGDTEVDVRFMADNTGTSVLVEHRGWERLGPDGAAIAA